MFSSVFTGVLLISWLNSFPLEVIAKTSERRCYVVDLTAYFNISGGTFLTVSEARAQLQQLVTGISAIMPFDSRCWFVSVTLGHVAVNSGSQVTTIKAKFIFSAESTVPSNQVASRVSGCIDAVKRHQGSHMITVNSKGRSVPMSRLTISDKKSCCGQAPPPCIVTSSPSFPISPSSPVRSLSTFTIVSGNLWNSYRVVIRCYRVKVSLFYNIPGGIALTETDVRQKLDPALTAAKQMLPLLGTCNGVIVTVAHIFVPAPDASKVEIAAMLLVTADSSVQDNQVHHTLSRCMSTLRGFQSLLASSAPPINVNGTTYQARGSSVSNGESCCSPNPPPCTLLTSTRVGPIQTTGPEMFSSIGTLASSVIVTSVSSHVAKSMQITPLSSVSTTTNVGSSNLPATQAMTSNPVLTTSPILDIEKRCYSVQVILTLKTSGPVNLTVSDVRSQLQSSLGSAGSMLALMPNCRDVSLAMGNISVLPSRDRNVAIGATLVFSADNMIPRDAVASQVSGCISAIHGIKNLLTVNMRTIAVKGVKYLIQNIKTMKKKSCCGDVEPPCFLSEGIEIVNFTQNVSVDAGEDVHVNCLVKYPSPRVKVTWLRNGKRIPMSGGAVDGNRRMVVGDGSLIIGAATTMDAGIYTCVVSGPRGIVMRNVSVQVRVSQEFEVTLTLSSETYSSDLENKSSVRYHELASIVTQELENKFKGEVKGFHRIEVLRFREGSVVVDFLLITIVSVDKPMDEPPEIRQEIGRSVFKQLRSGSLGSLSLLPGSLVFREKPPPPINIAVKERTMEEVHLKWSHPENHEAYRIQAYVVRYYRSSRPNDSHNSSVAASHREFVLNELEQGTEYEIRMSSTNSKGEGRLTDPIRVTTKNNDIDNKWLLIIKILLPVAGGVLVVVAAVTFYCRRIRLADMKESTKQCKNGTRCELFVINPTFDQKAIP